LSDLGIQQENSFYLKRWKCTCSLIKTNNLEITYYLNL